ncbi:hypothetical protein B0H14DRAFT_3591907 [Mycena olivaceomarginata]|nr:hypothetical protein B0H14DRAFT_3591907 [Mycena olivaceomarginata]
MDPQAACHAQARALVPASLDFDSPALPLALSLRTSSPSLWRKKSTQSASRVRLLLTELKKRAAALVVRRRRHSATTTQSSCNVIWIEAAAATRFSRLTSLSRRITSAVLQFPRATPSPAPLLPWPFLILACIPARVRITRRIRLLVRLKVVARTSALAHHLHILRLDLHIRGAPGAVRVVTIRATPSRFQLLLVPGVCSAAGKDDAED